MPIPLLAIYILWINFITDDLLDLALACEPSEKNSMRRPAIDPRQTIFAAGLGRFIVWVGALVVGLTIAVQAWALGRGLPQRQTMAFTVLCFSQLGLSLAIRSRRESIFTLGLLSNKPLLGAVALTIGLHLMILYTPFFNDLFSTQPLTVAELGITVAASSLVFWVVELQKLISRRREKPLGPLRVVGTAAAGVGPAPGTAT